MAENDRIKIGQKACILAGTNVITSLDEDSAEAVLLRAMYEEVTEAELSLYKWRFATATENIKNKQLADAPNNTRFNVAYQQPGTALSIDTVMIGDTPIEYEREGQKILTNDTANDEVVVKYRYRADEQYWNPYFRLLIIYRLATLLAWSVARRVEIAKNMKDVADEHWQKAKTEDAQAQTNQKVVNKRLRNIRRGGGRIEKNWRDR